MSTLQSRIVETILSPRLAAVRRRAADLKATFGGRPPTVTLYYQPGDAYSHLCAQLLPRLRERLDVELRVVVVPSVEDATNAAPELAPAYAITDAVRIAPAWGLDLTAEARLPSEETRDSAERVLLTAHNLDAFLEIEPEVAAALWRDDPEDLHKRPMLDGPDTRARLHANYRELHARGHYQGGMWHFRGDWYWALDRLDYLEARLRGLGLVRGDEPLAELTPSDAHLPPLDRPDALRFFYSFRSPYSYIAAERSGALADRYGIDLDIRPVLPMVMRGLKVPRSKRMYIVRDTKREADRLGVPFGRVADPLGAGVKRCLAVFPKADEAGKGLDFIVAAGRAVWSRGEEIRRDAVLRAVLRRAGLDPALADQTPADGGDLGYAEANREALFDLGLWGVPSYQFGELAVWGQDRLWLVEEALRRTRD